MNQTPADVTEAGTVPTMSTHTMDEIKELMKDSDVNEDYPFGRAISEAIFQEQVAESRRKHDMFVRQYLGMDFEPKFNDAMADAPYLIMFYHTKKTRNFAIPPVQVGGEATTIKPGRMYQCSGQEARLVERVLASKTIEVLNLTPKREGVAFEVGQICASWGPLNGMKPPRPKPRIFRTDDEAAQPESPTESSSEEAGAKE